MSDAQPTQPSLLQRIMGSMTGGSALTLLVVILVFVIIFGVLGIELALTKRRAAQLAAQLAAAQEAAKEAQENITLATNDVARAAAQHDMDVTNDQIAALQAQIAASQQAHAATVKQLASVTTWDQVQVTGG